MEHTIYSALALGGLELKLARGEGEEIRRDRLGFSVLDSNPIAGSFTRSLRAVCNRLPVGGNRQLQGVARLQIRLIKARKCEMRAGRDKQRVHEIRIAIQWGISGTEHDLDRVFT